VKDLLYPGLDVGSGTAKIIVLDGRGKIIHERYKPTHGQPLKMAAEFLVELEKSFAEENFASLVCTGSAGKSIARLLGVEFINEVIAHTRAVEFFFPRARTIIDIGGEDSKLVLLGRQRKGKRLYIEDFALNTLCAAGTGAFLDQQAARLGYLIDDFSSQALKAKRIPALAGRCTVFAKSDMIHLQQMAVPDYEIIAGLCFAIIRNLKSNLARGKDVLAPVVFQGGVAANLGVRRAIKEIFSLKEGELIIPEHFATMGAIGAAIFSREEDKRDNQWLQKRALLKKGPVETERLPSLSVGISRSRKNVSLDHPSSNHTFLGIDVGSVSTKIAAITLGDNNDGFQVIAKTYLPTSGRPLQAIKKALAGIAKQMKPGTVVAGVGCTGSGRYLCADFVGADVVRNEITAQAKAALTIDQDVETIIEIGGQDSKFISLQDGVVLDFTMNKACAAGTGSFLEEQAVRLGINIEDFGDLAMKSRAPVKMMERCTVFMQSDLVHYQQQGVTKEDLAGGLCYAIVYNYLNKVMEKRKAGEKVFFQGGTAKNKGIVSAFSKVLQKKVIVPKYCEVTGAIGAALLAADEKIPRTKFKGFELSELDYSVSTFECSGCVNRCQIQKLVTADKDTFFYGARCEKYEKARPSKAVLPDLIAARNEYLTRWQIKNQDKEKIGIPRALVFMEWLPFFGVLFQELGFDVELSDHSNGELIQQGTGVVVTETCFPIKLAHGHLLNLIHKKGVKNIFLPQIADLCQANPAGTETEGSGQTCPLIQSLPWIAPSSIDFKASGTRLIQPILRPGRSTHFKKGFKSLAKELDVSWREMNRALDMAWSAQREFWGSLIKKGKKILDERQGEDLLILVGRPYNAFDPGSSLHLSQKLSRIGALALPMDFLPLEINDPDIYWGYGQKILAAARFISSSKRLFPIYVTNFACGPDSFIFPFFKKAIGDRPCLELEIDEHSADAGIMTRIEAFWDSLKMRKRKSYSLTKGRKPPQSKIKKGLSGRTLFIPYMSDHALVLAASFRSFGIKAQALPPSDDETLRLGREVTSGKECLPLVLTLGDMLKLLRKTCLKENQIAFFMPTTTGPCRFGLYNKLQRQIINELGFKKVDIFSPDQSAAYGDFDQISGKFSRLAWQGIMAVDVLQKLYSEFKPYLLSREKGEQLYSSFLGKIGRAVEKKGDILHLMKDAWKEFSRLPYRSNPRPVVGVIGEIYVRSNQVANSNLFNTLENLGLEVWTPFMGEWLNYVNFTSRRWAWREGQWKRLFKLLVEHLIQKRDEERFFSLVKRLRSMPEPDTSTLINWAKDYIHPEFEGEAILSVGKTVDYIRKKAAGVINAMPFSCMPGSIVDAVLKRLRQDYAKFPALTLSFDGQRQTNILTRLEAFVYQVKQYERIP